MIGKALAIGLSTAALLAPSIVVAADFSSLYVFGDSLADNGNFYEQSQQVDFGTNPAPFPPDTTGTPYPAYPGHPYYQGRFSNGPVWVEFLNQNLGLSPSSLKNFASGGAGTGTFHRAGSLFPGMTTQITSFLQQSGGALDPNGLYILSAGSNDYSDPSFTNPADILGAAVNNVANALGVLRASGAKNFMVVGVPDFGLIPETAGLSDPARAGLSALSAAHNGALAALIPRLEDTLNAEITFLDIASLLRDAIDNPSQYVFTNVTDGCLFVLSCATDPNQQDQYLFWDISHPTTAAHRQIARLASNQLSIPEPSTVLAILAVGLGGWLTTRAKNTK
jgi:phospholipase/lecithinase/hemolysin